MAYKWKGKDLAEIEQKLIWRYESNPFDRSPAIFIASHKNTITGFRGFILQWFVLNDTQYNGFIPADAIVHPSYRRLGVFSQLNTSVISHLQSRFNKQGFILNLTSNKMSRPGNLKQGWQPTNGCRMIFYRVSIRNYLRSLVFKNKTRIGISNLNIQQDNIKFEFSNAARTRDLALFWEKHRTYGKITVLRNEEYYSWRYSAPGSGYVFFYAMHQEKMEGYLVLRKGKKLEYTLEEYHASSHVILKKMLALSQKKLVISVLKTATLSEYQRKILVDAGFTKHSWFFAGLRRSKKFPILVRPICTEPQENDFFIQNKNLRDMENWALFQADAY